MAPIVAAVLAMAPAVAHPGALGGGDLEMMFLPLWRFLGASLRAGRLPLWMPTLGGGFPFVAYLQSQALYPPAMLLFTALPLAPAAVAFMVLHLAWAGLGTAWLARRFGHQRVAAICAGVLVAASPVLLGAVVRPNVLAAASWIPWIAAAAQRAVAGGRGSVAVLSACVACGLLAGSPEVTAPAWIAAGLLAVGAARRRAWLPAGRVAAGVLLGATLAMPALLPFAELLAHSSRDARASVWALHAGELGGLVVPLLPATPYASESEWFGGPVQRLLPLLYLGAPSLLLGGIALWRREKRALLWWAVIVCGIALAMFGGHTNRLAVAAHLSMLRWRYPAKLFFPAVFGSALLAVTGATAIARGASPRLRIAVSGAGLAVALLGVWKMAEWGVIGVSCVWVGATLVGLAVIWRWIPRGNAAVTGMSAACLIDALAAGWSHRLPPKARAVDCDAVWAHMSELAAGGRVWIVDPAPPFDTLAGAPESRLPLEYRRALCLSGDRSARYGVDDVSMYGSPLLRSHDEILERSGSKGAAQLGATIAVAWSPSAIADLRRIESPWPPAVLARIPDAAPRVALRESVDQATEDPTDVARIVSDEGSELSVETASEGDRFLVLADVDYPGWRAEADGAPAPIVAAYGVARAVHLSPGRHVVRFVYRPLTFRVGLAGAAAALVVLALGTAIRRRRESIS